jgi:hypothetical protein
VGREPLSDAGLPGLGLRLGAEMLRGPNGVWYSATGADGRPVGVLRFDPQRLAAPGAVERLVDRVVAARAGMLGDEVLPIIDLVEDSGRIWLITRTLPVAATADRTERALLGTQPGGSRSESGSGSAPGSGSGSGSSDPVAQQVWHVSIDPALQDAWRPEIDLGASQGWPPATPWAANAGDDQPRRRLVPLLIAGLLAALVAGAGVGTALFLTKNNGTSGTAIAVSSLAVNQAGLVTYNGVGQSPPKAVTTTDLCRSVVRVVATLQTNQGQGTIDYRWDIPNAQPILKSVTVRTSDPSPYSLVLDWTLNLHGSGTVVAKFTLLSPTSVSVAPASVSLTYAC